jgi:alpha-beta hydrolase superfamily lysophospholipase
MEAALLPSLGATLHRALETPAGIPRATLVVVHGYAEHTGRYAGLVKALVARGYATFSYDYRGHGRATGPRGHVDRFVEYVDDLRAACEAARTAVPGRPLVLLAQSHGGLVALRALLDPQHAPDVAAAVLTAPFLGLAMEVPAWKTVLGRAASRIAPRLAMPNGLNPDDFSHDPAIATDYRNDPLNNKVATARWFTEMTAAQTYVRAHAGRLRVPTLWLLAGNDRVVSTPAAETVYAAAAGDKTLHRYDGLYHELYNEREPDRSRVLADLFSWLDGRFPPA